VVSPGSSVRSLTVSLLPRSRPAGPGTSRALCAGRTSVSRPRSRPAIPRHRCRRSWVYLLKCSSETLRAERAQLRVGCRDGHPGVTELRDLVECTLVQIDDGRLAAGPRPQVQLARHVVPRIVERGGGVKLPQSPVSFVQGEPYCHGWYVRSGLPR